MTDAAQPSLAEPLSNPYSGPQEPRASILAAVDDDALTWERHGSLTYYRLWLTEDDYRVLTQAERRCLMKMLAEGELKARQGWRFGIGGVERVR